VNKVAQSGLVTGPRFFMRPHSIIMKYCSKGVDITEKKDFREFVKNMTGLYRTRTAVTYLFDRYPGLEHIYY